MFHVIIVLLFTLTFIWLYRLTFICLQRLTNLSCHICIDNNPKLEIACKPTKKVDILKYKKSKQVLQLFLHNLLDDIVV